MFHCTATFPAALGQQTSASSFGPAALGQQFWVWERSDVAFSIRLDVAVVDLAGAARFGGRDGVGARSPAEYPRRIRFLRAVAVVVALLLRGGRRARQ